MRSKHTVYCPECSSPMYQSIATGYWKCFAYPDCQGTLADRDTALEPNLDDIDYHDFDDQDD